MIDTWRTRRAPGGSLPIRYSGTDGKFGKHSEGGREVYRIGSRLELRDAGRTRTTSGIMVSGSALGDTRRAWVGSGRVYRSGLGTRVIFREVSERCGASGWF